MLDSLSALESADRLERRSNIVRKPDNFKLSNIGICRRCSVVLREPIVVVVTCRSGENQCPRADSNPVPSRVSEAKPRLSLQAGRGSRSIRI